MKPLNKRGVSHPKWNEVNPKAGIPRDKSQKEAKGKSHVCSTYKGKNPMTHIEWRRHQRKKKDEREALTRECEALGEKHDVVASKPGERTYSKRLHKEERLHLVPKMILKPPTIKGRLRDREITP